VRLISLQTHDGVEQLKSLPPGMKVETLDGLDRGPDAFVDTAAVMASLDLVVASDTAVNHLAGALGRPAWLALKQVPNWRWLLDRDDCPWYPSMKLYRQERAGDWSQVFERMAADLDGLVT
jgi:ADP-heptose:LPS heptosyltransferase